jgi:glycosidase
MAKTTDKTLAHQLLYSVFLRNHTPEGTFRALEGDLDRLRDLGTDIVWLMPIHPIGEEGRKGTLGSPYAIRDYRAVNPEYGTEEDLRHLVGEIHRRGMKCIIDVVYNHTSPDSVLAKTHPEWFFRDEQGRPSRHVADWWDIVDLDYRHRELWRYQIDTLKQWAAVVDGFRCDVASSVPVDFWVQARQEVEAVRPGCIWLAESVHGAHVLGLRKQGAYCATDTELYRAFDMTYDYDIWPWFEGCLTGKSTLAQYIDMLNYQELTYPAGFIKMRCGENHDTPRLAAQLGDEHRLRHWLAFLYFCRGSMLLYGGTEFAPQKRVGLFDADDNFGDKRADLTAFLRQCKAMKAALPLSGAAWYEVSGGAVIGHYKSQAGEVTGVFDLSGSRGTAAVPVADGVYEGQLGGRVTVSGGHVSLEGDPFIF